MVCCFCCTLVIRPNPAGSSSPIPILPRSQTYKIVPTCVSILLTCNAQASCGDTEAAEYTEVKEAYLSGHAMVDSDEEGDRKEDSVNNDFSNSDRKSFEDCSKYNRN